MVDKGFLPEKAVKDVEVYRNLQKTLQDAPLIQWNVDKLKFKYLPEDKDRDTVLKLFGEGQDKSLAGIHGSVNVIPRISKKVLDKTDEGLKTAGDIDGTLGSKWYDRFSDYFPKKRIDKQAEEIASGLEDAGISVELQGIGKGMDVNRVFVKKGIDGKNTGEKIAEIVLNDKGGLGDDAKAVLGQPLTTNTDKIKLPGHTLKLINTNRQANEYLDPCSICGKNLERKQGGLDQAPGA